MGAAVVPGKEFAIDLEDADFRFAALDDLAVAVHIGDRTQLHDGFDAACDTESNIEHAARTGTLWLACGGSNNLRLGSAME